MLSRTNKYIAVIHTFEYGRFKGTFLQNHFSEKALRPIITRVVRISRRKLARGRKIAQTYGNGDDVL